MLLADQNKQSLDFLLKAQTFPIALLVQTPAWASVCSDWAQKQQPHDKMHSSLCTPAGTTQLCACSKTPILFSLDVLHSSPLHYWAEILKEKGFSFLQKSMNSYIDFLWLVRRIPTLPEEWNVKLIQRRISLLVNILNWHNQPKIHCLNVRKQQIKYEHTHPQNLVLNLSVECFLSPRAFTQYIISCIIWYTCVIIILIPWYYHRSEKHPSIPFQFCLLSPPW